MGIDGWTFMMHDPIQIKQSENIGRNVIDNFETAIRRDKKQRGFVIAFSFGRGAHEEVARVKQEGLEIHLVTVDDLLSRLDEIMKKMVARVGLKGIADMPMPKFEPSRVTAEELVQSLEER